MSENKRCEQIKCSYYILGGCKNCDTCNAEPYNIKLDCGRCFNCENREGSIRWRKDVDKIIEEELLVEDMIIT
tara:strand:+ start:1273 stop:1491 length:219 start_codon:yes stop_codon:yes gene_type:complete